MDFQGSKTFENLMSAFAGECQAFMAYTIYANQADKKGLAPLTNLMNETAANEKEHAEAFFKRINNGGDGQLPSPIEGLKRAIKSERFEAIEKYKDFERIAHEEGFDSIAELFRKVRHIEERHMKHFEELLTQFDNETLYTSDHRIAWVCSKCGNVEYGTNPPEKCPVCEHEGTYYEREIK